MSSLSISPIKRFLPTKCPCGWGATPMRTEENQKINGDWCNVTLAKRNESGEIIRDSSYDIKKFKYTQEISTGNLYNRVDKIDISSSGILICIGSLPYMAALMFSNVVKTVYEVCKIAQRALQECISNFATKGIFASASNLFMAFVFEIPSGVLKNVWQIAKSPLYAVGMMFGGAYTAIHPYEGRQWIAKIESAWHNVSYKMGVQYRRTREELHEKGGGVIWELLSGKVCFLGYCMQKRGSISDKVDGQLRFELYKKQEAKIKKEPIKSKGVFEKFKDRLNLWKK